MAKTKAVKRVSLLGGNLGREVLEKFREVARRDYNNVEALNCLSYSDSVVKDTNLFAVALVADILPRGKRIATLADLERMLRTETISENALGLRQSCEDVAIALRSGENQNAYLAENLIEQLKDRGNNFKLPVMINLSELKVVNDSRSDYGLSFELKKGAKIIYAPVLRRYGMFSFRESDEETGLPRISKEGNRTLVSVDEGLSGLSLFKNFDIDAAYGSIADSCDDGKIVIVCEK